MSYDINLKINTGKEMSTVFEVGNLTYNVRAMLDKAFNVEDWKVLHGQLAGTATQQIKNAIYIMEKEPDEFRALNPKNGWGNYESTVAYLKILLTGCETHPLTTIEIS